MSAGQFINARYAADYGDGLAIHPIRIQPETESLSVDSESNTRPSGAINNPISAVTSRGRRQRGLRPRTISIRLPLTGQPTGYQPGSTLVLPALNRAIWDAAQPGDAVTYLGVSTCTVVGKSAEQAT